MSNKTDKTCVEVRRPGIPFAWYADEAIHGFEHQHIFSKSPSYIGHELMVPHIGDYRVCPAANGRYVLVRNEQGIEVFENICPHGKLTLLTGHGNAKKIICPGHHWVFDPAGHLLAAPAFSQTPCLALRKIPTRCWNGMRFESNQDIKARLSGLNAFDELDFDGYELESTTVETHDFNWKVFLEICLENYHLNAVHPGLAHFVDLNTLQWHFGQDFLVQTLAPFAAFEHSATPVYGVYQEHVRRLYGANLPRHAGVWAYLYPDINVEWYPFSLIISRAIPHSAGRVINVTESYYRRDIMASSPEFISVEQAARQETADEDEVICHRMQEARRRAYEAGDAPADEIYHRFLEAGRLWFHDRLRKDLAAYRQTDLGRAKPRIHTTVRAKRGSGVDNPLVAG